MKDNQNIDSVSKGTSTKNTAAKGASKTKVSRQSVKTTVDGASGTDLLMQFCCNCSRFRSHPGRCSLDGSYKARKACACVKFKSR